jgi:serine kinase of HPr protein (carbohydrate metabolism regulator)
MPDPRVLVHASCVAVDGAGILLRGPSGSGKSDLALRLIDAGASLVADDQTWLAASAGRLVASAPAALAGKLEVRGLGIVTLPALPDVCVALIVDLVGRKAVDRLPPRRGCAVLGVSVPLLSLDPFDASAAAKVRLAVRMPPAAIQTDDDG